MRGVLLSLMFAAIVAFAAPAQIAAHAPTAAPSLQNAAHVYALQIPDKKVTITIGDKDATAHWYRNPVWIAIGVLAVLVVILLIILAARGGGTTIIRD